MRRLIAFALALSLPAPLWAEGMRPLPRPASVEVLASFATATPLAPRKTPRPPRGPAGAEDVVAPAVQPAADRLPAPSAGQEPDAALLPDAPLVLARLTGPGAAPDPIPDPARSLEARLGATRGISVTMSSSGAMAPVFVAAALAVPRPPRRPDATAPVTQAGPTQPEALIRTAFAPVATPRPPARPQAVPQSSPQSAPQSSPAPQAEQAAPPARVALASPRPKARPKGLAQRAAARAATPKAPETVVLAAAAPRIEPGKALVKPRATGAICGDPAIQGAALAPITSQVQGCGIAAPVRVTSVDGVRLSSPATLDCDTARALRQWVTTGLKPAVGRQGVSEIRVVAHYACRPRNNVKGARVSEHGRGKAIDIAGITLASGQKLSVLGDYRRAEVLQKVRRAACGIFGTTLGPGSDRHHADHFHFDTARHRNGPYCR